MYKERCGPYGPVCISNGYYVISCRKEGLHGKRYHDLIEEDNNGPRPKGWIVHHQDGNKLNNAPDNLKRMPREKHQSYHMAGENHPLYGKSHSNETKLKISKTQKSKYIKKENHPRYGKKHSVESKKKQSEVKIGKYNKRNKSGMLYLSRKGDVLRYCGNGCEYIAHTFKEYFEKANIKDLTLLIFEMDKFLKFQAQFEGEMAVKKYLKEKMLKGGMVV